MSNFHKLLDEFTSFNEILNEDKQFTIIDGSQFENPELDENGDIIVRDQHGNIVELK